MGTLKVTLVTLGINLTIVSGGKLIICIGNVISFWVNSWTFNEIETVSGVIETEVASGVSIFIVSENYYQSPYIFLKS